MDSKYHTFDIEKIKLEDINLISFNAYNPKQKRSKEYEKVYQSVKSRGMLSPIFVREIESDTFKYQIIDGEQRFTACLDLGYEKVPIYNMGNIDETEAKALTLWLDMNVPFDQEKLGAFLIELVGKVDLPYTEQEIELISGISLTEEDDFDNEEFENKLKTVTLHVTPTNRDNLLVFLKDKQEELNVSENMMSSLLMQVFKDSFDLEKYQNLIEEERNKELEYFSGE